VRIKGPDEGRRGLFRPPRVSLQRGVIILPSAFTLGNLFFGMYAIVAATRSDFLWAAWFIVWAGILDMLDGRVARFTRTGSRFGAELDSLVDAVSFGVAPGLIMYQLFFSGTGASTWSWTLAFVYETAIVVRLARFNVEQAGHAKTHFHGLPSPTAGLILATYYPFSQTEFFQTYLYMLPWQNIMAMTMVLLAVLMVSHVPYAVVPRIGVRTVKGMLTTAFILLGLVAAVTVPRYFFFPFLVAYTVWGLLRSVLMGLVERLPDRDPLLDEEEAADEADAEVRAMDYTEVAPARGTRLDRETEKGSNRP
jgi:CDP-diacylglycerol--serine O-phosphatidyltransferase